VIRGVDGGRCWAVSERTLRHSVAQVQRNRAGLMMAGLRRMECLESSGSASLNECLISLMMLHSCHFYFELRAAQNSTRLAWIQKGECMDNSRRGFLGGALATIGTMSLTS
jgi:hypothetical protein